MAEISSIGASKCISENNGGENEKAGSSIS